VSLHLVVLQSRLKVGMPVVSAIMTTSKGWSVWIVEEKEHEAIWMVEGVRIMELTIWNG